MYCSSLRPNFDSKAFRPGNFSEKQYMAQASPGRSSRLDDEGRTTLLPHLALITQQSIFGISTVLYKLALPKLNPLTLCLVREVGAGFVLFFGYSVCSVFAWKIVDRRRKEKELLSTGNVLETLQVEREGTQSTRQSAVPISALFFLAAFFLWAGQVATVLGLKLYGPAGAVVSSAFHPTQPLWTALFSSSLKLEGSLFETRKGLLRLLGCLVGAAGAWWLIFVGNEDRAQPLEWPLIPASLFLSNAICSAVYVITVKLILLRYDSSFSRTEEETKLLLPIKLTASIYLLTAVFTISMAFVVNTVLPSTNPLLRLLCDKERECIEHPYAVPDHPTVLLCFVWVIVVHSAFATFLQTWALSKEGMKCSQVAIYTLLQVVASMVATVLIVYLVYGGVAPVDERGKAILRLPGVEKLGGVAFIGIGLVLVCWKGS